MNEWTGKKDAGLWAAQGEVKEGRKEGRSKEERTRVSKTTMLFSMQCNAILCPDMSFLCFPCSLVLSFALLCRP